MTGDYPRFKATYAHEELVGHFLLSPAERALIATCRGDVNRQGVAVLLKAVQYLGDFPSDLRQVPEAVRALIARQSSGSGTTRWTIRGITVPVMFTWH